MPSRIFEIIINSTEANKDLGFEVLSDSGLSVLCLEDEKYIIPEEAIKMLKDKNVAYEVLTVNGEQVIKNG